MRITGMATGLDTDTLIKQMMKPYTMKVDKMKQDRQIASWRQDLYREILADTKTMRDTYFDLLKPDTNILNKNNYSGFDVTATSSVVGETAGVSATASVGAVPGNYKVEVTQLATTAKIEGDKIITPPSPNKYTTKLSDLLIGDGETLTFKYKDSSGILQTKTLTVSEPTIPETSTISKDATISELMDSVNKVSSGAVKLNFSELTGTFTLETLQTGSSATLEASGGVQTKLQLNLTKDAAGTVIPYASGDVTSGINAIAKITPPGATSGVDVEKTGNTFSIDGVNYSLTKLGTTNITVAANSQKTYDKILGFIDKYNQLVDKISEKVDEKKQYKYLPLSDEEKTAMKEEEIKQWETKAKVGLLKGDANLDNMLTAMRRAFYDEVEGVGISLSEIGLSTSADTSQRGKIIVDETKLKTAIETKGDKVADLFAKQSTTHPYYSADYTNDQTERRNKEQGIFQKINDILQDYTRTGINAYGKKGILVEKAGLKGDISSILSKDIIKKDEKINEMIRNLAARENKYYLQFSKLETAMNKMNSQSSWLTQQLGGGQ